MAVVRARPGAYITPEVKLVRPLGGGGMGSVWLAEHEARGIEVAVKLVSSDLADRDPAALMRFQREVALSSQIDNPHAVHTYDHGVADDGTPYLVMERLHGETLARLLVRRGRLTPFEVSVVIDQVSQVLDQAHELGVVHRDIKPDNVFVVADGHGESHRELCIKVLDFGIAKEVSAPAVSPVTDIGAIVGTPEYMSPEQLLTTGAADERADRWALAVLAYQALTGELPFNGETLPSLSLAICNGRYAPPSRWVSSLPAAIDDWFATAFATEPGERFDSVLVMAASFATALGELEEAPPQSGRRPSSFPSEASVDSDGVPFDEMNFGDELQVVEEPSPEHASDELPALLDAPPALDSGVRDFVPDAEADQSGRRRALTEAEASRAVSPTFSGAAKALRPEREPRPWLTIVGVTAAAALVMIAASVVLVPGEGEVAPAAGDAAHDRAKVTEAVPAPSSARSGEPAGRDAGAGGERAVTEDGGAASEP
ncbi:MAG TPA: serine/threonine protein kinase [Polyangiaceae bacterium]|nr:serine/threonine protein kinase [Polyangiaceae bacterium]